MGRKDTTNHKTATINQEKETVMEKLEGKARVKAKRRLKKIVAAKHKAKARGDLPALIDLIEHESLLEYQLSIGATEPATMARD